MSPDTIMSYDMVNCGLHNKMLQFFSSFNNDTAWYDLFYPPY